MTGGLSNVFHCGRIKFSDGDQMNNAQNASKTALGAWQLCEKRVCDIRILSQHKKEAMQQTNLKNREIPIAVSRVQRLYRL